MRLASGGALVAAGAVIAIGAATCHAATDSPPSPATGKGGGAAAANDQKSPPPPAKPSTETSPSTSKPSREQALSLANDWLQALKTNDPAKLSRVTQLPFTYKSLGKKRLCERTIKDTTGVESLLKCFYAKETLFLEELKQADANETKLEAGDLQYVPKKLLALLGKAHAASVLVTAYINGDGVTYTFLLAVGAADAGAAGVRTFALKASFLE